MSLLRLGLVGLAACMALMKPPARAPQAASHPVPSTAFRGARYRVVGRDGTVLGKGPARVEGTTLHASAPILRMGVVGRHELSIPWSRRLLWRPIQAPHLRTGMGVDPGDRIDITVMDFRGSIPRVTARA